MLKTNLLRTPGLVLVFFLLPSCSTSSSGGDTTLPDSSAADTSDVDVSFESCPAACAAAKTCDKRVEPAACEAQCHKELAGQGYLNLEIVGTYFEHLASLSSDLGCSDTTYGPWYNGAEPEGFKLEVQQPAVLDKCVTVRSHCGITPSMARVMCFYGYYWFSAEYRSKIDPCLAETDCTKQESCLCANEPGTGFGKPWVTIAPDPTYTCN